METHSSGHIMFPKSLDKETYCLYMSVFTLFRCNLTDLLVMGLSELLLLMKRHCQSSTCISLSGITAASLVKRLLDSWGKRMGITWSERASLSLEVIASHLCEFTPSAHPLKY